VPLYTAEALVLRTYKLGEADRIVVFLTRDRGKKRGVAKGARRARSTFAGALEPLTEVRVAYFEKERRELVGLNYAETIRSPLAMTGPAKAGHAVPDDDALGYVGYFAELLDEWAQADDPSETLFRLGASVLDAMAAGVAIDPLVRYFEYWLLRLQGVYPPHLVCHHCGARFGRGGAGAWLSPVDGVLTCAACADGAAGHRGAALSPDALGFLGDARTRPPREMGGAGVEPGVMAELEAVHRLLMARHLERELRSPRVLRAIRRG
jgi:DNA repair protein RecO (recombination protein O)